MNPFDLDARQAVDAAQLEYDATPAGMKELKRRIHQGRNMRSAIEAEYELRLKLGEAKRAERLALVRAQDNGDVRHESEASPNETFFGESYHRFSTVEELATKSTKMTEPQLTQLSQITRAHEGRGLLLALITGCDRNCCVGSID